MTNSDALWENASGGVAVTWPLVTPGSHGTTVLHVVLLLRKNREPGMHRTYFRTGLQSLPVRWVWRHFRWKGPTRADIAHAQNILPGMAASGYITDVTSGHVISGCTTANTTDVYIVAWIVIFWWWNRWRTRNTHKTNKTH